jgi:hypothetical protein
MNDDIVSESDAAITARHEERLAEQAARVTQLRRDSRAVFSAMTGWQRVTTHEAWQETCLEASKDYQSGRFLIEQLGAGRHLDPELMATLWGLRQMLVAEGVEQPRR